MYIKKTCFNSIIASLNQTFQLIYECKMCVCMCDRVNVSLASRRLIFRSHIISFLSPLHQQRIGRVFNPLDFNLLIVDSHCCQGTSHFLLWNTDILPWIKMKIWIWSAVIAKMFWKWSDVLKSLFCWGRPHLDILPCVFLFFQNTAGVQGRLWYLHWLL